MSQTVFFKQYITNINQLLEISEAIIDNYFYKLLYAHIITIMEEYLSDAFIATVKKEKLLMRKLLQSEKYKTQSVTLAEAYENDIENIIINRLKKQIYHNLSDIKILYRDTLNIDFKLDNKIIQAIKKRHDIIHRNGKDVNGILCDISINDINDLSDSMRQFLSQIDKLYVEQYNKK